MGFISKALAAAAFMYAAGVLMVTCMAESVHSIYCRMKQNRMTKKNCRSIYQYLTALNCSRSGFSACLTYQALRYIIDQHIEKKAEKHWNIRITDAISDGTYAFVAKARTQNNKKFSDKNIITGRRKWKLQINMTKTKKRGVIL